MQIKKFTALTLREATEQMKNELGEEAIILSTRVKEADPSTGKSKMFELVAGIEDEYDKKKVTEQDDAKTVAAKKLAAELSKLAKNVSQQEPSKPKTNPINKTYGVEQRPKSTDIGIEDDLKNIVNLLAEREVNKQNITTILNQLKKYKNVLHSSNIETYLLSCISSMINTHNFELKKRNKPYVVSVVGPTGVGKTTCIAKLAVISKILHNLNVGLISLDTYRLGALDQLRIFSEISNIDMLVAYEASELPIIINNFKKKDIIFIDTAGRSQKNANQLLKNKELLDTINVDETFLTLSATSSLRTLYDITDKFRNFKYNSLIFTKIDEAAAFGNILNVSTAKQIPISFISNGQVIPDDIISADSDFIANLIISGKISK